MCVVGRQRGEVAHLAHEHLLHDVGARIEHFARAMAARRPNYSASRKLAEYATAPSAGMRAGSGAIESETGIESGVEL